MKKLSLIASVAVLAGVIGAGGVSYGTTARASSQIQLLHVAMFSANSGWGTTSNTVVRTSDGGKHWKSVLTVPRHAGMTEGGPLFAFASIGGQKAWVVEVSSTAVWTYRTLNAGKSWWHGFQTYQGPGVASLGQMVFANPTDGWLLLHGGAGAGQAAHEIIATTNSGGKWKRVEYQLISSASKGSLPACNGVAANISFSSASQGWASGICGAGPQEKNVYRTADGGHTWHRATVAGPYKKVQYFDAGQVVVTGAMTEQMPVSVASPGEFVLYRSGNGGKFWTPTSGIKVHSMVSFSGPVYAYAPFSRTTSWVVTVPSGGHETIWRSVDGGDHWKAMATTTKFANLLELDFASAKTGFALSANTKLYVTHDAGKHWSALTTMR